MISRTSIEMIGIKLLSKDLVELDGMFPYPNVRLYCSSLSGWFDGI